MQSLRFGLFHLAPVSVQLHPAAHMQRHCTRHNNLSASAKWRGQDPLQVCSRNQKHSTTKDKTRCGRDRQTDRHRQRDAHKHTHTHTLSLFLSFFLSFFRTNARQLSRAEWETDSGDLVPVVVAQPHTQSIADFQMGIQNLASLSDNPFVVKPIGMCQQPPTLITPVRALWFFVLFCFLIF